MLFASRNHEVFRRSEESPATVDDFSCLPFPLGYLVAIDIAGEIMVIFCDFGLKQFRDLIENFSAHSIDPVFFSDILPGDIDETEQFPIPSFRVTCQEPGAFRANRDAAVVVQENRKTDSFLLLYELNEFLWTSKLMPVAKVIAVMEANHGAEVVEFFTGVRCVLIRKDVYECGPYILLNR